MWNIRGVDDETRAAAKKAARECGMTLGGWMTRVIGLGVQAGAGMFTVEFKPVEEKKIAEVAVEVKKASRRRKAVKEPGWMSDEPEYPILTKPGKKEGSVL